MASNEKTKILQMVEDGKITVDEAVKLIDAIRGDYYRYDVNFDKEDFEDKINKFAENTESFAKDLSGRFDNTWKSVEPKVKDVTKSMLEKTYDVLNNLAKSIDESINNMKSEQPEEPVGNGPKPENNGADEAEQTPPCEGDCQNEENQEEKNEN